MYWSFYIFTAETEDLINERDDRIRHKHDTAENLEELERAEQPDSTEMASKDENAIFGKFLSKDLFAGINSEVVEEE